MPLLQFETTVEMGVDGKRAFADSVRELYCKIMETEPGHVAVVIRERSAGELSIGRETGDDRLLFLDADVRAGRPFEQRREFTLAVMDAAADEYGVPEPNMKVVFTEHDGSSMMGYDRVGSAWDPDEAAADDRST